MNVSSLTERFLRYVKIDTQSDDYSGRISPSTDKQRDLAEVLVSELRELGIPQIRYDEEHSYVYACLPGEENADAIGFLAHIDTSPAVCGGPVCPRIIEKYDGNDLLLDPKVFSDLTDHIGEDLVATDGKTLLGADDKAGIAEIMTMLEYYAQHPEVPHATICAAFTSDEEIGKGTAAFDYGSFPAKTAYTVDGGAFGLIEYECFNAAKAVVTVHGRSTHPGTAKNRMINACHVAADFQGMLPEKDRPEKTEGYEGYFMISKMEGDVEHAQIVYIVRDHDRGLFEKRKEMLAEIAAELNASYGEDVVEVETVDQYYNMAEIMKDHMEVIDRAEDAIRELGGTPKAVPIRGGTDGSALTWKGIPCPNLCTGGYNAHSRYEYASIQEMEKCAKVLIKLAGI